MSILPLQSSKSNDWCIYVLIDPRDEEIRYVGWTHDPSRRYTEHIQEARRGSTYKNNWLKGILRAGLMPDMKIVDVGSGDQVEAEVAWIAAFRELRCRLTNLTDGGEGTRNYHHSDETRKKISESNRNSSLRRRGIRTLPIGYRHSSETREKLRQSHLGIRPSEETKRKRGQSLIGKHPTTIRSEEVRQRERARYARLQAAKASGEFIYKPRKRKLDVA